eukprot:scaffold1182_cov103-Cylindrotheca_fusiformis.AAC.1
MIQDDVDDTTESNMASLEKFKPAKWVTWKLAFLNQLGVIKSLMGAPLSYVVRDESKKPDQAEIDKMTLQDKNYW